MSNFTAQADYLCKRLKPYVGWKIVNVIPSSNAPENEFDEEAFPCIIIQKPRTKEEMVIVIMRDDEGNGPGSIDICPIETTEVKT